MIKLLTAFLTLACLCALPAQAKDRFATPVEGEIMAGWLRADGTRIAAIRLTLAPGWKTYWRAPGEGGIPPQFDWSGSGNLKSVGITWPTPKVSHEGGMQSYVYEDELVLPVQLSPRRAGQPIKLRVDLDIGVCSDVCVPHQMTLRGTIADTNAKPVPAIAAALAARPYSGKEGGLRRATCALRPTAEGLEIETRLTLPSAGGHEAVVVETGNSGLWVTQMDTRREGRTLISVGDILSDTGGMVALTRSDLRITVLGKKHAVEIKGCTAP